MHSDGQGCGALNLYQNYRLIAFHEDPSSLPTGDGGRYILHKKLTSFFLINSYQTTYQTQIDSPVAYFTAAFP